MCKGSTCLLSLVQKTGVLSLLEMPRSCARAFVSSSWLLPLPLVLTTPHFCRITTPQHAAVICNNFLQECTCMILPGVGHVSNEEAPRLVNACLVPFCKHAFTSVNRVSGEEA